MPLEIMKINNLSFHFICVLLHYCSSWAVLLLLFFFTPSALHPPSKEAKSATRTMQCSDEKEGGDINK